MHQPHTEVQPNFFIWNLGVSERDNGNYKTLNTLLRENGHLNRKIHYLKVRERSLVTFCGLSTECVNGLAQLLSK